MTDSAIERLAQKIARDEVIDWVYGDSWYGWPNPEDDDQMAEAEARMLPLAREKARWYLGDDDDD
jgi:hypothetical protein